MPSNRKFRMPQFISLSRNPFKLTLGDADGGGPHSVEAMVPQQASPLRSAAATLNTRIIMSMHNDLIKFTTADENSGGPSSTRPFRQTRPNRPHRVRPSKPAFSWKSRKRKYRSRGGGYHTTLVALHHKPRGIRSPHTQIRGECCYVRHSGRSSLGAARNLRARLAAYLGSALWDRTLGKSYSSPKRTNHSTIRGRFRTCRRAHSH